MLETSRNFIYKCWLLDAFNNSPKAVARVLELLEDRVYMPLDTVVMFDDYPDGMYFIDTGVLGVYRCVVFFYKCIISFYFTINYYYLILFFSTYWY